MPPAPPISLSPRRASRRRASPFPSPLSPPEQNTYAQYLAAKALRQRNWRYNKQYNTWFQRLREPREISAEYETGDFNIFDYETAWRVREKKDFRFLYQHLEAQD